MNLKKIKFSTPVFLKKTTLLVFLWLTSINTVQAAIGAPGSPGGFSNPLKFDKLSDFLNALLDVIILIGVPIVVFAVIYAGFLFVTAQGNTEKITTAKRVIVWTLIGAMLVLGSKALALAIQGTVEDLSRVHTERVIAVDVVPWES